MTFLRIMTAYFVCLGLSVGAYADSLLITYQDGTTQQIPLDKTISAISKLQYLNPASAPVDAPVLTKPDTGLKGVEADLDRTPKLEPKNNLRIRWAEPVIGQ